MVDAIAPPEIFAATLREAFLKVMSASPGMDWNEREAIGSAHLRSRLKCNEWITEGVADAFLGGDALRPYLTVPYADWMWVIRPVRAELSMPKLLVEMESGALGGFESRWFETNDSLLLSRTPLSKLLRRRLKVPIVFLLGLTNAGRYQTRRYPLGIARLAQWLRFQHAAKVTVGDLALNYEGDVDALCQAAVSSGASVLGISLNFGEFPALRRLIDAMKAETFHPTLIVGNVLAAWAAADVKQICAGFDVHISYSYGEHDIEALCRSIADGNAMEFVAADRNAQDLGARSFPPLLVMPDEALLAKTLSAKGQASLETSFGCQYGRCTFCPRDHRSPGWRRPAPRDACAILGRIASVAQSIGVEQRPVLSFVDEEAFGNDGNEPGAEPSIVGLVEAAGSYGMHCEVYTRLEQLYDSRRSLEESYARLQQWTRMRPWLARVFVGVESGCDSQLRRYGKGQTTKDIVSALRVGSLLGLPMEFGFITFDPLLGREELVENVEFLARTDILLPAQPTIDLQRILDMARSEDEGTALLGTPLFLRVAYMATELEVFANSAFLRLMRTKAEQLVGDYDSSFARYNCRYSDPVVGQVAAWCRVWTEGTFEAVYRVRVALRTGIEQEAHAGAFIERYRTATFGLLVTLLLQICPESETMGLPAAARFTQGMPFNGCGKSCDIPALIDLWKWVSSKTSYGACVEPKFSTDHLEQRRES